MSDDVQGMEEELVATMIMEVRPNAIVIKNLARQGADADGSALWSAILVVADTPGQSYEEELRVKIDAEGELTILP